MSMVRSESRALPILLAAMTLAAYLPALSAGFIWDDDAHVTGNQTLRSLDGLRSIWFEPRTLPQYYPLVHTSFWIEYHLWGLAPAGFHLINILLHACNALLLWRALKALKVPGAALAGFVFALHPVNVESVAWVTERKNVLSLLLYLLAFLAYLRFSPPENEGTRRKVQWRYYWISLALFLCALLSKTVTCSLPAALLLIYWWKRGRITWRDVAPLIPMLICGLALASTTVWLEKAHVGAAGMDWKLTSIERCLIAGRALWFYAGKLFWPVNLTFIYPRWVIDSKALWQYLFPAAALAVAFFFFLLHKRIGRGPLTATLFFAGSLFPALGFINVYPMLFSFVADHFQYLASIGPIAASSAACAVLYLRLIPGTGREWIGWSASAALLLALGTVTWQQTAIYHDPLSLWQDTIRKNPACWMARENLGVYYAGQERYEDAVSCYFVALQLHPDDADTHRDLGIAFTHQRKYPEATEQFKIALRLRPDFYLIDYNLGVSLFLQQRYAEAVPPLTEALRLRGNEAEIHHMLAQAYGNIGRFDEAARHYREALSFHPDWSVAMNDLAWLLATSEEPKIRDGAEGVRLAKRACELTGYRDVNNLDTLAASSAEAGNFAEAIRMEQATLELGRSSNLNAAQLRDFQNRLELYRKNLPYRDHATSAR
jgi:tetratricopeptide (TPR) repeat protein